MRNDQGNILASMESAITIVTLWSARVNKETKKQEIKSKKKEKQAKQK